MLAASIRALGLAGVPAWWLSDAPPWLAATGAAAGLLWAWRLSARERGRAPVELVLDADGRASIGGADLEGFAVDWRGTLVTLGWRRARGRERRLLFPDALHREARRELRLWALARRERRAAPAVAP